MEYKYKAFISYRHLEPDMQAAEKLQKLLEAYKPPKNLGKTKENWRIFRDVSELQSSSDLSEDIRNAIDNSEFLIVICSPKYNESKWCKQELTRFRELHNNTNDNIITLLVNGQPHEAFPEELTYTEVTTTDENGKEVKVRMEVEPLAANITADTLKESMKKLDTEYLRIAAPLLECDFNDLFQREKRREAARRRRIFGGVSGILSLITIISVASAVTINGKNVRIQQQNDQIKEQNSQIIEQNEQIEKKNNDLLVENAGHLAVESENLFREKSLIPAIWKSFEALPQQEGEKPVIPEAEYALSRELGMFCPQQLRPRLSLRHDRSVEQISFVGGGKAVASQDGTGVYFWNAETGELLKKITPADSEFASERYGEENELTAIFDVDPDRTGTFFTHTSSPGVISYMHSSVFNKIYSDYVHSVDDEEPGTGGDVYLWNSDHTIWRLDGTTGNTVWTSPLTSDASDCLSIMVRKDHILRLWRDSKEMLAGTTIQGDGFFIEVIDRETGAAVENIDVSDLSDTSFGFIMDLTLLDVKNGRLYVYSDEHQEVQSYEIKDHAAVPAGKISEPESQPGCIRTVDMEFIGDEPVIIAGDVCAFDLITTVSRCDSELKEKKWSTKIPVNYQSDGKLFFMPAAETGYEHDALAVLTSRTISFVDYETGALINTISIEGNMIDSYFTRRGLVVFTCDNGKEYVVSLGHFTGAPSDMAAYNVQNIGTTVSLCSYSRGKYVTAGDYSNTAYIQCSEDNPSYTGIDMGEYMYSSKVLAVSDDGSLAAISSEYFPNGEYNANTIVVPHFYLYNRADGSLKEIKELENYYTNSAAFAGNQLFVNANKVLLEGGYETDDKMFSVSISDLSVKTLDAPVMRRTDSKLNPVGDGIIFLCDSNKNIAYISADGKCSTWVYADNDEQDAGKEIVDGKYAVRGDKAALLVKGAIESAEHISVYSFGGEVLSELDCAPGYDSDVCNIFWQNDDTVGVFFSDNTVSLFDAGTGNLKAEIALKGMGEEPVSVAPVTDDTFAVLCRDSYIYEMNEKGLTGRSCRLEFGSDEENAIREYDSSEAEMFETQSAPGDSHIYAVWGGYKAWLLDTEKFAVRYRIDDFAAAPADSDVVFISDDLRSRLGFFPVYTTEQLLGAAREYLTGLGEM